MKARSDKAFTFLEVLIDPQRDLLSLVAIPLPGETPNPTSPLLQKVGFICSEAGKKEKSVSLSIFFTEQTSAIEFTS